MKTNHIFAIIGAVFLIFVGFLLGKQSNAPTKPPISQTPQTTQNTTPTMTVEVTTPTPIHLDDSITASGLIHAKSTAEVSAKLTGATINQVLVEVGDIVKAGQVLATLDDSSAKESLMQATADHEQALASHEQALADLARVEPLLAMNAVSRQQVDTYRTNVKQAQAATKASLARLNTAKNNLANTQITSPVSGVVGTKNAQVGMAVSGTPLFSIIKNGQLEWQATLSPADADKIRIGQTANITVADDTLIGKVTHLSPMANSGREIIVHVATPPHPMLKAGTYQRGRFVLGTTTYHAIPQRAVMSTDGHDYVWALTPHTNKDNPSLTDKPLYKATRTRIQVFAHEQDKVATDLPADTLIVANNVSFLSDNELVKLANPTPTTHTDHANIDSQKGQ